MSLSTYVQFIRNGACIVRDFSPKTVFYKSTTVPFPFTNVILTYFPFITIPNVDPSYIEYLIGISQFYVVLVVPYNGVMKLISSSQKLKGLQQYELELGRLLLTDSSAEVYLLHNYVKSLIKVNSFDNILSGLFEIGIGLSFIFLTFGSFHIHLPLHPKPIIDALIFMEVLLLYFLYVMWNSFYNHKTLSVNAKKLIKKIETAISDKRDQATDNKDKDNSKLVSDRLEVSEMLGWAYDSGFRTNISEILNMLGLQSNLKWVEDGSSDVNITNEIGKLSNQIKNMTTAPVKNIPSKASKILGMNENKFNGDQDFPVLQAVQNYQETCARDVYFDFTFLFLNIIAFYAYMISILPFYFGQNRSNVVNIVMMGLSNETAEFYGAFAGDLAWTIEPLVVIFTPLISRYIASSKQSNEKVYAKKNGGKKKTD